MIPKIIHYCWVGGAEKPESVLKCIESWKKYCPDYEIIEWNESNYDFTKNNYMKQAYEAKRWGFVPDYARLDIVYNHGGIYLDTDVELVKSYDSLLKYPAFFGFENTGFDEYFVNCGQGFGAEPHNEIIKAARDLYDNLTFIDPDNSDELLASPYYTTQSLKQFGLEQVNKDQQLENAFVFASDVFCPKSYNTGELRLTNRTLSIHHFSASWYDNEQKHFYQLKLRIYKLFNYNYKIANKFIKLISYVEKLKKVGLFKFIHYALRGAFTSFFKYLPIKNTLFFESEGDFADNCYAFYKYLVDNGYNRKYKIVWKVQEPEKYKNHKKKNVIFISDRQVTKMRYYLKTSKYFFFTHPSWFTNWREGQTVINFWHGVGPKNDDTDMSYLFNKLIVPSDEVGILFKRIFKARDEQLVSLGMPRIDLFGGEPLKRFKDKRFSDYNKVIICMPTYRRTDTWSDSNYDNRFYINTIENNNDFNELNSYLKSKNLLMIVKIHHLQKLDGIVDNSDSNILYVKDDDLFSEGIQLYELVKSTDALLTDYSSVYTDYLNLDKPIGFFINDFESYYRGFCVENPLDYMPGEKIKDKSGLFAFLNNVVNNIDEYKEQRLDLRNRVFSYNDFENCKRIAEYLNI